VGVASGRLESLKQGEVIRIESAPRMLAPAHPLDREEVRRAGIDPSLHRVASLDLRLDPALAVVISQDCDLVRDVGREPYVLLAPLTRLDGTLHREVMRAGSSRFFSYPPVADESTLAVDMRLVFSLEKPAISASEIERLGCPLTEPQRSRLRSWLGARFARVAFPDEIARLVEPIRRAAEALGKDENFARAFSAIRFSGLRYTEGVADCSLLLLVEAAACVRLKVNEELLGQLQRRLHGRIHGGTKDTGYAVSVTIATANEISALDLLSHHPLSLGDFDAAADEEARAI
jgi:hypothetical protein